MRTLALGSLLLVLSSSSPSWGAKDESKLEMKIIAKKDSYILDREGKTVAEYKKSLEQPGGPKKGLLRRPPQVPAVDLVLEITNNGKEATTLFVGGDPNVITLDLKGPTTLHLAPLLAFTSDFKLPKEVTLAPGKTYEIPLKQLSDGFRNASRYIYWLEAGEYTLGATYQLAGQDGAKGELLRAEPIKLKVEDKK